MPDEIVKETLNGNLIIFAGAGISTEKKGVFLTSFYEDIRDELKIKSNKLSFSELVGRYTSKPNGRKELIHKIKKRMDYMYSFPEIYRQASSFHVELSTIFYIKTIITTNWDDLFEKECGAIPIVGPEDFTFWDLPDRKVFKIHGSINNVGSLIATKDDYNRCYRRLRGNIMGSHLRMALATKTIVFVGYSFGDEDFSRIYKYLAKDLGRLIPHSYLITLDQNTSKYRHLNTTPIITDATYFLHSLKNILCKEKLLLNDDMYVNIEMLLAVVLEHHGKVSDNLKILDYPYLLYSLSYQDGLIHSLERIVSRRNTGEYSDIRWLSDAIKSHEAIRKKKLRVRIYHDVAYLDGYINGLYCFAYSNLGAGFVPPSIYYVFGANPQPDNYKKLKQMIKSKKVYHKAAFLYATEVINRKRMVDPNTIIQHSAFL
ncbi:MAG: SIR2 family protein [Candidatus Saganbacteria bacterium]|nr:SIR2 family protein [Candidatus Saganbacteria bacterium]